MYKRIISALSVVALLATAAVALSRVPAVPASNTKLLAITPQIEQSPQSSSPSDRPAALGADELPSSYIVRTVDGVVGLYQSDGTTLIETLPIFPQTLRADDAAMLERGIEVADERQLAQLVEDFSS